MPRPARVAQPRSLGEQSAVSSQLPPRDRRPENREVRIQAQSPAEPGALRRAMAQAALDHPAVEELERIERSEPEGALRVAQRLTAVPGPLERPSQDVVAVDRRPLPPCEARECERRVELDSVIDVEERGLEIGLYPVRDQQALDDGDQLVLLLRQPRMTDRAVEVTERRDVLGQRDPVDGVLLETDCGPVAAHARLGSREGVECVGVVRKDPERLPVLVGGGPEPADRQVDQAELNVRPGGGFALAVAGCHGELHRADRAGYVAEQLARVGDPGIRGKARLHARHRVEGLEGGGVAAELDERVADDAVVASRRRRDRVSVAAVGLAADESWRTPPSVRATTVSPAAAATRINLCRLTCSPSAGDGEGPAGWSGPSVRGRA